MNKTLRNITLLLTIAVVSLVGCKKDEAASPSSSTERAGVAINTDPSKLYTLWPLQLGPYFYNFPGYQEINTLGFWYTDQDTCNVTIKLHTFRISNLY